LALPLWEVLLDAATVGSGTRLLDAGCGAGGASVLAAWRGAQINGLDASEQLVAIARGRVLDADFRVGDLEALPYTAGTFDAIIAANALEYTTDPVAAACELRRVCSHAGLVAIATRAGPEECQQHAVLTAIYTRLRITMRAAQGPPCGSLCAPGVLEAIVTHAGLTVCGGGTVCCLWDYPDLETAWRAQVSSGPLQAALRVVGPEHLRAAVLAAAAPYQTHAGRVRLVSRFIYIVTTPSGEDAATGG
jgi:SAM-dependent methyltransferase